MIRRLLVDGLDVLKKDAGRTISCAWVSGIGYEVILTDRAFSALTEQINTGQAPVVVETHHHVSDIEESLFGFASLPEFTLFQMLVQVKGVGNKTALAAVGAITLPEAKRAVRDHDLSCFTNIPGIGKQTAERIYTSLKKQLGI